jgi:hypothetical protein
MTTNKITGWSAVRSGSSMTIRGVGPGGGVVKLSRISEIRCGENGPVAVRDNGLAPADVYALA